jgi:acyl-CoA reductase-like NAD-dependent aldehyde dehydrogenase
MAKRPTQNGKPHAREVSTARDLTNPHAHATTKSLVHPDARSSIDAIDAIDAQDTRLSVLKTYKVYIGGKFPRGESGRFDQIKDARGKPYANYCLCSRKDFRDAVVAARSAQSGWAKRSAYNRAQILYRIAEMLEGRKAQFVDELVTLGGAASAARNEVQATVDRLVYYAGWADKYQQVFSSVNPVASSHFNFSILEPTGVVAILAPQSPALLGLVSLIAPAIVGGNSVVALASTANPLSAVTFSEVLATSDLPGGVVNLLTGKRADLLEHMATHLDVNAVVDASADVTEKKDLQQRAATNVKRVSFPKIADYFAESAQSPYLILDTQEVKTTWHPIGT